VSERTFFAGLNRNIGATINRSATTYGVQNSISDRLSVCHPSLKVIAEQRTSPGNNV